MMIERSPAHGRAEPRALGRAALRGDEARGAQDGEHLPSVCDHRRGDAPGGRRETLGLPPELGQSRVKVRGREAPDQFSEASSDEEVELEAASGLEPEIEVLQGERTIKTKRLQTL